MRGVINAEHVYATARSHRAAFDSVGRVEQTENRAAVRFFNARHEFSGFAQALLSSGRDLVRFMWIDDDKSWYAVRIDAETRPTTASARLCPPWSPNHLSDLPFANSMS